MGASMASSSEALPTPSPPSRSLHREWHFVVLTVEKTTKRRRFILTAPRRASPLTRETSTR